MKRALKILLMKDLRTFCYLNYRKDLLIKMNEVILVCKNMKALYYLGRNTKHETRKHEKAEFK